MLKFEATVTQIGINVGEFLEAGIIVLFNEQAPEELAAFAILHNGEGLTEELAVNDRITIDNTTVRVLAVGDVANANLRNLGHVVMKFNGQHSPELPGDVCVEEQSIPPIHIGSKFRIESDAHAS